MDINEACLNTRFVAAKMFFVLAAVFAIVGAARQSELVARANAAALFTPAEDLVLR
jgi:hypothetical protein